MRSLFAKTLLWFLATTAVAIGGIILTTALTFTSTEPRGPFGMLLSVQVEEAKRAYETGGRAALATVLSKFQQITQIKVVFTDAKGTDLLTGQAASGAGARAQAQPLARPVSLSGGPPSGHRAARTRPTNTGCS